MDYAKFDNRMCYKKELTTIANGLGYGYISEAYAKLYEYGKTVKQISELFNVSDHGVRIKLKEMGIKLAPPGGVRLKKVPSRVIRTFQTERGKKQLKQKEFIVGRIQKTDDGYMIFNLRCRRCQEIVFREHKYNEELFTKLRKEHFSCEKKIMKKKERTMGKALISTMASLAFNAALLSQFNEQHPEQVLCTSKEFLRAGEAIDKGFRAWKGSLYTRDLAKIQAIEEEMAKRTFMSDEMDIVTCLSFGIAILENLMIYIVDEERREILSECIESLLALQQKYDKDLDKNHYYEIADKSVKIYKEILNEVL